MSQKTSDLLQLSHQQFQQGLLSEAQQSLEALLIKDPTSAEALSNLGYLFFLQKDFSRAVDYCEQAIQLAPQFVAAYSNLGMALLSQQKIAQAIDFLQKAVARNPQFTEAHINLGIAYQQQGQVRLAIQHLQTAIALNPQQVDSYCNLASCYQDAGDSLGAIAIYEKALSINPNHSAARSNYLLCLQYDGKKSSANLKSAAAQVMQPLNQKYLTQATSVANKEKKIGDKKSWRIGLVSADFHAHPVGWFIKSLLPEFSAQACKIFCYYNHHKVDAVTQECQANAFAWRNIFQETDDSAQKIIQADDLDILIDLSGHTANNRLSLFAEHLTPLQFSWLGYPATTGLSAMDAVLLSEDLITEATPTFFTEKIIPVEGNQFVYSPPNYLPEPAPSPFIKNGFITFGCFNNLAKINDDVLVTWAKLMHELPSSRLILKWKSLGDAWVRDKLLRRFHSLGIAQTRIELRGFSAHVDMLKEYADIDIALDPFPFSGALTSFEAVWMGVPVITLYTHRPCSRQTYSINKTLGLNELSASTPQAYISAAKNLAGDTKKLQSLRGDLRARAQSSALTDAAAMVRSVLGACEEFFEGTDKNPS